MEKDLLRFEKEYYNRGYSNIAGIDEAGRGPLAGPVVSAAVMLHKEQDIEGVYDSKQIAPVRRMRLFDLIMQNVAAVGVGIVHNNTIDEINILQATMLSMHMAIANLASPAVLSPELAPARKMLPDMLLPDMLLIDGLHLNGTDIPQQKLIKGDCRSRSIAAASIIAKVTRDKLMERYHEKYPQYNFKQHKGYGTKEHMAKIRQYGACPIHRQTFKGVRQ